MTHHPIFPVLIAIWFAALFALASFAIPTWRLESWSIASGIDTVIAAAAPPLGHTARLLFALLCAAIGGASGAMIGKAFAEPTPARPRAPSATAPDWPLAALEEAGAAPLAPLVEADDEPGPGPVFPVGLPQAPMPTAAERIATADLAELSHVELVERLAIGLDRRRANHPALREADVLKQGYSVLREFVRSDAPAADVIEHPVVSLGEVPRPDLRPRVRIASSGQDPEDTERALRDALSSLQHMSRRN